MGSIFEINDTLQITSEQGFPAELDYEKHKAKPFTAEDFEDNVFEFKDKQKVRLYQQPPVRNFLVHNIDGKWLYWGLINIIETVHDNDKQNTSGKFKIVYIYTPEEMEQAHQLIDRREEINYLNKKIHHI
ncbi:MAG: hypothetical protein ACNFW9_02725 [Candidatus Kerfeldbacteria bacterium]